MKVVNKLLQNKYRYVLLLFQHYFVLIMITLLIFFHVEQTILLN